MRIQYIANDGMVFYTEERCLEHDKYLERQKKINEAMDYIELHKIGIMPSLASWLDYTADWWTAYIVYVTPEMKDAIETLDPYGQPDVDKHYVLMVSGDNGEAACYQLKPIIEDMRQTLAKLDDIVR